MSTYPLRIAIIDDHTLFRKTIVNYLSEQKNLQVVIHTGDASELIDRLKETPTDILIVDLFMPNISGDETLKIVKHKYPAIKLLALSMCTDLQLINEVMELGIHGYISKTDEPEDLIQAIFAVSQNRIYRTKLFTEALYWNKQSAVIQHQAGAPFDLEEREIRIIQLIWEEKNSKEIADELFLSVRSIEKIRQDLKEKLGVRSTVGLLKYALRKKMIITSAISYKV